MPAQSELKLTPGAAYVHMTSNNTIEGTEYKTLPDVGDVPLVNDTSSDMFSRPIDVAKHALIYAGAQKNIGPAGVTLVIIREDMLPRSQKSLPTMLNYAVQAENGSMYNTPPTFAVYTLGLVMKWLIAQGGLAGDRDGQRAQGGEALRGDRPHRLLPRHRAQGLPLADERHVPAGDRGAREAFVKESTAAGLDGLKGHRSVGGMRASIYNAFPEEGVDALVAFMREFERETRIVRNSYSRPDAGCERLMVNQPVPGG